MAKTDWDEESEKLKQTINGIDKIINNNNSQAIRAITTAFKEGSSPYTFRGYVDLSNNNYLLNARLSPYFGRTDIIDPKNPKQIKSHYIGQYHIPMDYVYSLGSPIAHLFYDPFNTAGRKLPPDLAGCTVTLKRILTVQESKLKRIQNVLKLKPGEKAVLEAENKQYLTDALSVTKGQKLKSIIVTIQPKQYQIITSANFDVVVLNGVSGSGKTEVGLHRIVYLLSPANGMEKRIKPEKVAFIGPNHSFLAYVTNLLPGVGIEKITYRTFNEWLRLSLPTGLRLQKRDALLDKILCNRSKTLDAEISLTRFKTSTKIMRLIERHVADLRRKVIRDITDIFWQGSLESSKENLLRLVKNAPDRPINALRTTHISYLEKNIHSRHPTYDINTIRKNLETQINKFWPYYEPVQEYQDLLYSLASSKIGKSLGLSSEEQKLLLRPLKITRGSVNYSDVPAISYMNLLLSGATRRGKKKNIALFDHIVIDECQDLSPIEFAIFTKYSNNNSFTVLMDTNQNFLYHKSILSWNDIKTVVDSSRAIRFNINTGYRTTYELTKFDNRLLGFTGTASIKAIPYDERHGEKPRGFRSKSYKSMITAIIKDIEVLQNNGSNSIAILCKTDKESRLLMKSMIKQNAKNVSLLENRNNDAGVYISSIYNAKGMEFDAVILANVRRTVYPNTLFHNRLLYLGVTRAALVLHIHWYGTIAEILNKIKIQVDHA